MSRQIAKEMARHVSECCSCISSKNVLMPMPRRQLSQQLCEKHCNNPLQSAVAKRTCSLSWTCWSGITPEAAIAQFKHQDMAAFSSERCAEPSAMDCHVSCCTLTFFKRAALKLWRNLQATYCQGRKQLHDDHALLQIDIASYTIELQPCTTDMHKISSPATAQTTALLAARQTVNNPKGAHADIAPVEQLHVCSFHMLSCGWRGQLDCACGLAGPRGVRVLLRAGQGRLQACEPRPHRRRQLDVSRKTSLHRRTFWSIGAWVCTADALCDLAVCRGTVELCYDADCFDRSMKDCLKHRVARSLLHRTSKLAKVS